MAETDDITEILSDWYASPELRFNRGVLEQLWFRHNWTGEEWRKVEDIFPTEEVG